MSFNRVFARGKLLSAIFFMFMMAVASRGVFELYVDKAVAYLIQVGAILFFLLLAVILSGGRVKRKDANVVVAAYALAVVSGLGMLITLISKGILIPAYILVMLFTSLMAVLVSVLADSIQVRYKQFVNPFLAVCFILAIVAFAQQLYLESTLPGSDLFYVIPRPASLTGSFLHYPLIISLGTFVAFQAYKVTGFKLYYRLTVLLVVAVFLSLSRSGMFIVSFGYLSYALIVWVKEGRYLNIVSLWLSFVVLLAVIAAIVFVYAGNHDDSGNVVMAVFERFVNAGSAESAGNEGRIDSWLSGLQLWWESNMLFGEYFGLITNVSRNMGIYDSTVVESGLIQNLLNLGLIGTMAYYSLFILLFRRISPSHLVLRCGFLAGLAQTIFLQSIEIVPYICTILLFPVVSSYLRSSCVASASASASACAWVGNCSVSGQDIRL